MSNSHTAMTNQSSPSANPVTLPASVAEDIIRHAREGKPEEICGILRGRGLAAFTAIRARNVAIDRIDNYDVDPQTLLRQFEFEDEGDEMMGIYHSHPVSVAYPSATDAWNAHYPDSIYLICSLENDEVPVIRTFRMITYHLSLDLHALNTALDFYETRPGLFGYFVADNKGHESASSVVDYLHTTIAPPYYLVYATKDGSLDSGEGRIVSILEHPLVVTDDTAIGR